ncbi:DEAD/DEAH box helicase [Leptolyngbya sp. 15MV]|nr:DEAD/DEAH box helicase [Leptolyngbya sp. 15MV]
MQFDAFLTRADDEVLQQLLGAKALRLLRALDPNGFSQAKQRELLLGQTKAQELLASAPSRKALLELLRADEVRRLCQLLGLDDANPYEQLTHARFKGERFAALLDFFELPLLQPEAPVEAEAKREVRPLYPLFSHQAKAARRTIQKLRSGTRRVLLHMPTGAGKTRTAMNVIAEQLRDFPHRAVIWLAHSEELCEQAASEFEKAWGNLGSHEVNVRRFWGSRVLEPDDIAGDFIVAGLPKMNAVVRSNLSAIGKLGKHSSLVIMDEAHQAIAHTYQLILDALVEPYPETSLLGLSATPGRTWNDIDHDEQLASFFARQKVVLEIDGYDNPVEYLVDQGYLAKSTFRPVLHDSGFVLSDQDQKRIEEDLEVPKQILERLAEDEIRNLVILSEIRDLVKRHRRVIVFAATVEHSDLLAYVLRAQGLWARSVTGATPGSERQAILDEFKDQAAEPKVVCNFGVLTTGFDAPQTSAAVIARPTTSLVLYSQMVGRAIRGPQAGGSATAEIVTVVDSALPGFGDVGDAFLNWEDVWGSQ